MADIFIGVDPGSGSGAIAALDRDGNAVFAEECNGPPAEVWNTFAAIVHGHTIVAAGLEKVHSMPKQGVSSTFKFGENFGTWQGIFLGRYIPFQLMTPQTWVKEVLRVSGVGNDGSLEYCRRRYPEIDLHRKKDHGKADALCIAEWTRQNFLS